MWAWVKAKSKAVAKWFYDWATVITAISVAGVSSLIDQLDVLAGVDFTAFVSPKTAAQIVAVVALVKAAAVIISAVRSKLKGA